TYNQNLAFRVLLSEASVSLKDDITSRSGSVELLRLTLSKLLLNLCPSQLGEGGLGLGEGGLGLGTPGMGEACLVEVHCASLQVDNQLYNRASFHFPVLLCQEQSVELLPWTIDVNPTTSLQALEEFKASCFLQLGLTLDREGCSVDQLTFHIKPARLYLEDTFVYYVKTLFHTYIPDSALAPSPGPNPSEHHGGPLLPKTVLQSVPALVHPLRLQRLAIQPVNLLVSIHASLKLYIASDHTPLSFSMFERGPLCTTARQLIHALAMHYAAGALFRAGWVVGSLDLLGSPASLVRSIGNGVADFFRLPYEGLTRGPGAFVSGVSRGTTSFVKHISKGTWTDCPWMRSTIPGRRSGGGSYLRAWGTDSDRASLDWASAYWNFQRGSEMQSSAGSKAKGVISGVGKGIMLQSLGRPEVHMALEVVIVSGSGQEHAGCLLLTGEVLFVVSLSEDTQQQAFPITEGDSGREQLSEQQYGRLVDYVTRASAFLSPSASSLQQAPPIAPAEPPAAVAKTYRYLVNPAHAAVFVSKFTMVKNKALRIGFH
ncbi:unnamed protein product, partial [Coregonus sp. 'balchen']